MCAAGPVLARMVMRGCREVSRANRSVAEPVRVGDHLTPVYGHVYGEAASGTFKSRRQAGLWLLRAHKFTPRDRRDVYWRSDDYGAQNSQRVEVACTDPQPSRRPGSTLSKT